MQTDVNHKSCNKKAILISASFKQHFDPNSKKETRRNKTRLIAKYKILHTHSKQEKRLEKEALFITKWLHGSD